MVLLTFNRIEWEAFDVHSGLKTVQWRVFDNFTGTDVVHGIAAVAPQGNTQVRTSHPW